MAEELRADPEIDAIDVAIAAKGGVITLTDFVHSYNEKIGASGPRSVSPVWPQW